jgi:hypothetical protein
MFRRSYVDGFQNKQTFRFLSSFFRPDKATNLSSFLCSFAQNIFISGLMDVSFILFVASPSNSGCLGFDSYSNSSLFPGKAPSVP